MAGWKGRLFRAGRESSYQWGGVCEVTNDEGTHYIHHIQWPERRTLMSEMRFTVSLESLLAGPNPMWEPAPEEWEQVSEGL